MGVWPILLSCLFILTARAMASLPSLTSERYSVRAINSEIISPGELYSANAHSGRGWPPAVPTGFAS